MENLKFRTLNADEIECRVGTVTDKGCSLLMYKDARVDMRLLDEVVGAFNWKREHVIINNNLYCTVSIYNKDTKEWVSKQDVGVESQTEKEKGQASDSFKRACFNWGIGRELYTCPFVWVNLSNNEISLGKTGSRKVNVRFYVDTIEYKDGKVTKLVIKDESGKQRYSFPNKGAMPAAGKPAAAPKPAPVVNNNPNLSLEDKLGAAVLDVEACKTEDELITIYNAYKADLGQEKRFVDALKARKEQIINAA